MIIFSITGEACLVCKVKYPKNYKIRLTEDVTIILCPDHAVVLSFKLEQIVRDYS